MRAVRYLLVSGSAAVAAGSLVVAALAAAATAAAPGGAVGQPPGGFRARAHAALVSYLSAGQQAPPFMSGDPGTRTVNQPASPLAATSVTSSYNWSGYADVTTTANTFTRVSGQWRTPRVRCGRQDQLTAEWVGIDGYNNGTVEQDGTLSWCYMGRPTYFTWYDVYPAATIEVGRALHPGDKIAASVTRRKASYTLALTDFTHPANSFSAKQTCTACLNTSVEWIAERPGFAIGTAPLADYGSWRLSRAAQTAGGTTGSISGYPAHYKIGMVDATGAYPLSVASGLDRAGSAFSTHWANSY